MFNIEINNNQYNIWFTSRVLFKDLENLQKDLHLEFVLCLDILLAVPLVQFRSMYIQINFYTIFPNKYHNNFFLCRITGAMGQGLAALTFDKDYQKKRRNSLTKRPTNLREGLARGGKGLVTGVTDGITGVFTKPISGAKADGFEGFFKGLGKGAVGLVARPTAGLVDFASGTFESVKRATEVGEELGRLRSPRFLHSDGIVRPFNKQEAEGNKLLK